MNLKQKVRISYRDAWFKESEPGLLYCDRATPYKENSTITTMDELAKLVAALLADDPIITPTSVEGFSGIQYLAIGEGNPAVSSWETSSPAVTERTLFDETFRKVPLSKNFVEVFTGTGDTAGSTTTIIDTGLSYPVDFFNGDVLIITGDSTAAANNVGQARRITDWDDATSTLTFDPPLPVATGANTTFEIEKVQDPSNPVGVDEDRKILRVIAIIDFVDPLDTDGSATIREMGLFGGNATEAVDTGFCLLQVRHPTITKSNIERLTRAVRLEFL